MNITFKKVSVHDRVVFENLFQLFAYDFSELMGMDMGDDGKYPKLSDMEDYYSKLNYCSYFLKVQDKLAGIAVLRFDDDTNYFRHFFVMRKYRRMKVGQNAAHMIFRLHSGKWRVSAFDFNKPAIEFWENTFDSYTKGKYITQRRSDDKGPEFIFSSRL